MRLFKLYVSPKGQLIVNRNVHAKNQRLQCRLSGSDPLFSCSPYTIGNINACLSFFTFYYSFMYVRFMSTLIKGVCEYSVYVSFGCNLKMFHYIFIRNIMAFGSENVEHSLFENELTYIFGSFLFGSSYFLLPILA